MPGVRTITETRSGPTTPTPGPGGRYFAAGVTERGPDDEAILVRSLLEYEAAFGPRVTFGALWDDLRVFFEEGGDRAYAARIIGPSATRGTIALLGAAAAASVTVDAIGAGAWSSDVDVTVAAGALPSTVTVTVEYAPAGRTAITETFANLGAVTGIVNALERSALVRGTADGTALPEAGTFTLTAGDDDRAAITDTERTAALDLFLPEYGDGAVAIPGAVTQATQDVIIAHAEASALPNVEGRRLAILATPEGTIAGAADDHAVLFDTEYGGVFWPWIGVPDDAGGIRTVSPEGYVAGQRAIAHRKAGPWRAGANIAAARFVRALETVITPAAADTLDDSRVNVIRQIGTEIRLYGWRSLSTDEDNYALLTSRDVVNRCVVALEEAVAPYAFDTIDGRGILIGNLLTAGKGVLEPMSAAGGLFAVYNGPDLIDPGYVLDAGPEVNPLAQLALNRVGVRAGVRPSPTAALIELTIIHAAVTATL